MTPSTFDKIRKETLKTNAYSLRTFGRMFKYVIINILSYHPISEREQKNINSLSNKKGYIIRLIESRLKHYSKLDKNLINKYFYLKERLKNSSHMSAVDKMKLDNDRYMLFEIIVTSMNDEIGYNLTRQGVINDILETAE